MFTRVATQPPNTIRKNNSSYKSNMSVQFINIAVSQKKENENGKSGDRDDKDPNRCMGGPIHRSRIGRRTLKCTVRKVGNIDRYYYKKESEFQTDLNEFNAKPNLVKDSNTPDIKTQTDFMSVGQANVRLKFCSSCFDVDKENELEEYYVDKGDISQYRTVLCRGCIGSMLRKMKEEKKETNL